MDEQTVLVGIPTDGTPVLEKRGEATLLKNMLIGKDFHWQRSVEALLPGEVEIKEGGEYRVLNRVPLERYLECVVGSEMNPQAPMEFLKAHAVISRGWVLGKILRFHDHSEEGKVCRPDKIINWEDTCDHEGFDVCSDDHCQRYQGLQEIPEAVSKALQSTVGQVLVGKDRKLIDTRFSKCCGGRTELFSSCWQNREEESLESFEDPWCNLETLQPDKRTEVLRSILKDYDLENEGGYLWETVVNAEEIRDNLIHKFGRDIGVITDIEVKKRGASGRAVCLLVKGTEGELEVGKELMIRRLLAPTHLYSSWFEIEKEESSSDVPVWRLHGRGWGHGVGLCQIGAARMALEGYNYLDILGFYYPGSKVVSTLQLAL